MSDYSHWRGRRGVLTVGRAGRIDVRRNGKQWRDEGRKRGVKIGGFSV